MELSLPLDAYKLIKEFLIGIPFIRRYSNGNIHIIGFKTSDNQFHGIYKDFFENGRLHINTFYHYGKLYGEFNCYFNDNDSKLLINCYYVNNILHGNFYQFYLNGKLHYKCIYINGCKHGPDTGYYTNGRLKYEHYYKFDRPHGQWIDYYRDQTVCRKRFYKNGKRILIYA